MAFASAVLPMLGSYLVGPAGALSGVSTLLAAGSAIQSGNYQAAVARNNAKIAEQNAAEASRAAQEEARRSDIESAAETAALYAQQAVSGIDTGSRSSVAVRALSSRSGRLASYDISREGSSAAQRLKQQAANFKGEAKQAKLTGYINAASSLVKFGENAFARRA